MKILAVDDDADLLELVGFTLRRAGYAVVTAADGEAALRVFDDELPDLVVLDANLPRLSGFEVCRRIRARAATPILMLTVRSAEEDQVQGLDLGADDYVTKPFSPRSLLARVRALLRRAGIERPRGPQVTGDLVLDAERQTVRVAGGAPVRLTRLEVRLLRLLVANEGEPLHAERILAHVWGARGEGDRQLLKQLVHRLRLKIEPDATQPRYIVTVSGFGYVFHGGGVPGESQRAPR
jgi:DNA-binding response OmpR family regulator